MRLISHSLAMGVLAVLPGAVCAQLPVRSIRSVADVRERPSDEHDRPYFRETQSHRGFEIRTPQFTVFADTSREDAQLAAQHVEQACRSASELAARWTRATSEPDFGLSALQIVITNQPVRERDAPATTLTVVGIQTQVDINVAAGQPPLDKQLTRLRDGAAYGMLHAAGLDGIAPGWLVGGMAQAAGSIGLTAEEKAAGAAADELPRLGGQQWRYSRTAADQLAYPPADHAEAATKVAFLLTGNDGEHAAALFGLLKEAQEAASARAAQRDAFAVDREESAAPFDAFFAERSEAYEAWKEHPESGQPIFERDQNASAEVIAAQEEMVVVLKLVQRFGQQVAAQRVSTAKITELDKDGRAVVRRVGGGGSLVSFGQFAERLLQPGQPPWATLDARGQLLLSSEVERARQLLFPGGAAYELQAQNGKTTLMRRAENGPAISAWLEENPQDKSRPLAKFAMRSASSRVRVNEYPAREGVPNAQAQRGREVTSGREFLREQQ